MKIENSRKYLLIFSGVLLAYQYLGLVVDGNIPFTQIKVSTQANIPIVLTILILFFAIQYCVDWLKQKKEERSYFYILSSIPIALIAIVPVCYGYLKKFGIDWKIILSTILLLLFGCLLAVAVDFIITIIFSRRTPEEMQKMGLGKIPSAAKAFIRCLFFLVPLSTAVLFLIHTYKHLLPIPLNSYWLAIFSTPTLILDFENFKNLLLCLGPRKTRERALGNLRLFRRAMDIHEMHYQYIGIEEIKIPELPPICELSRDGMLDEVEKLLLNGENPNSQDGRGWCPLMWASAEGHLDVVLLLLEHGADPNVINYLGRSAIMYASSYGYYEIAKALVEKGAILNPSREFTDHPPLSAAADKGHLDVVKLLVEHGANVMHKGKENLTALDIAMDSGHGEIAKYLRNKMLELDDSPPEEKTNLVKNIDWVGKSKKKKPRKMRVVGSGLDL